MQVLRDRQIEFLVGGAFALGSYTGIERDTKDFDIMLRPRDVKSAIEGFREAGYRADFTFEHWLAKVHHGEFFIDLIYRAGNGLCEVDDLWFRSETQVELFGEKIRLCPPEEIIWQKAYIMERERFDGADVLHLLRERGESIEWDHLVERFGPDWRVLYSHLVLFGFVYPSERAKLPARILRMFSERLAAELEHAPTDDRTCRGTFLSRAQYLPDIERWGYLDARLSERSSMEAADVEKWTNAIDRESRAI